jgi:hypothetical protein
MIQPGNMRTVKEKYIFCLSFIKSGKGKGLPFPCRCEVGLKPHFASNNESYILLFFYDLHEKYNQYQK